MHLEAELAQLTVSNTTDMGWTNIHSAPKEPYFSALEWLELSCWLNPTFFPRQEPPSGGRDQGESISNT